MRSEHATTMAAYNRWMNEKLYEVCASLSDEERKKDRSAFFRSIHGTLNHLLVGDLIWMGRFMGEPFQVKGLEASTFGELLNGPIECSACPVSSDLPLSVSDRVPLGEGRYPGATFELEELWPSSY